MFIDQIDISIRCVDNFKLFQQIWKMSANDFGGERTYIADFEIYDQRASDPTNVILDIYIGIK
jgi:predicted transcriptional regulator YdeE